MKLQIMCRKRADIPDMILAEDSGPVGGQMEAADYDFSIRAHSQTAHSSASGSPSTPQPQPTASPYEDIENQAARTTGLPQNTARNVMRKKLNHFQIEHVAEIIKDRMESELKIEKERNGEEP